MSAPLLLSDLLPSDPHSVLAFGVFLLYNCKCGIALLTCIDAYLADNPSDHIEGEAEIARKQAKYDDDGVIDKHEQKEIDKAHKRQLISRGRGPAQVRGLHYSE